MNFDQAMEHFRFDSAEADFVRRQLEHLKSQMFDIKYLELKARMFVPVSTEVDPGATTVTYQQGDRRGLAKVVGHNAKDLPRVDVLTTEFNRPVRMLGAAYGWNLKEVKSAAMTNKPLNTRKANAARRSIEELLDEIAAVGSPEHGIATGFINDANVPQQSVTGGTWATKLGVTPDDVIEDVREARSRIILATGGMEIPDTMLIPEDAHSLIATTPRSGTTDTSVLEWILGKFPGLTAIEPWERLTGAGAGSTDRMILYKRSPDVVQQEIVEDFTQLPVQVQGLEFVTNTIAQTAGTNFYYPLSADYSDGI